MLCIFIPFPILVFTLVMIKYFLFIVPVKIYTIVHALSMKNEFLNFYECLNSSMKIELKAQNISVADKFKTNEIFQNTYLT